MMRGAVQYENISRKGGIVMCQCFYCTNGKVTTPPDVKSFEDFVDLTTVTCKLGHKTGCKYCVDFHDVEEKIKKEGRKHANISRNE
jgi:hypothetical protein